MVEYIEREAARRAIEHADPAFCYCIDNIPAAEVAPVVRGHLVETGWDEYYGLWGDCDKCGADNLLASNFCRICGAKMDKEGPA